MHPEIEGLARRLRESAEEFADLAASTESAVFVRRPSPERWSAAEHAVHSTLVAEPYVASIEVAIEKARRKGWTRSDDRPFRRSWVGRKFIETLEPPPGRRVKTFKRLVPPGDVDPVGAVEDLRRVHDALATLMEEGDGLDLGKPKVASPFLFLLRFPVFQAAEVVAAHTDRHIWLARETLDQIGLSPSPSSPSA